VITNNSQYSMDSRMRVIFIGAGKKGAYCFKKLIENDKNIVLSISKEHESTDWGVKTVSQISKEQGIDFLGPRNVNSKDVVEKVRSLSPSVIIVAGFSQILKKELICIPKLGVLNCHGALLPKYRGSSPINWAIINGEKYSGCSIIKIDEGIDTGPILEQEKYEIGINDTVLTIHEKTFEIFPRLLLKALRKIELEDYKGQVQDESKATYYHSRRPEDGEIKWNIHSAYEVHNLIRGLTHPYPGAFTFLNGKKLFIWSSKLIEEDIKGIPGRVCFIRNNGVIVVAKDRSLLIKNVQFEEEKVQLSNRVFKKQGEKLGA